LVHFGDAELGAPEFAPFVVGCELGGSVMVKRDVGAQGWELSYRFGASIKMGAVIPRYSLENLYRR
jgi:hypothetical protein